MKPERRYIELRHDGRRLTGTAVRYGDTARMPWGRERFEAGAFAPLGDVILNASHDRARPLARTAGGGLVLDDGPEALTIDATLPETREADDILVLVRNGVMRGLSIEFYPVTESLVDEVRVISRAQLTGIGVVDTPAYSDSEVQARMKMAPMPYNRRWWL